MDALEKQVGGNHYKNMAIQPIEFTMKNKLNFCQGNIVKYATRYANKDGVKDLDKVIHYAELIKLLEFDFKEQPTLPIDDHRLLCECTVSELIAYVMNHKLNSLIMKGLINRMINTDHIDAQKIINEAALNHNGMSEQCVPLCLVPKQQ